MTRMLTRTRMPVFLPPTLFPLVLLPPTLPFLVLLPPALPLLVFQPPALPSLALLPPRHPPGPSNPGPSFPIFCSSSRFCLSPFSFPHSTRSGDVSHQDLDAHFRHATPTFLSPMRVFRATLLPLEDDYAVQRSISPLETSKKRLQLDIEEANRNKLWCQPVVASREEETVRLVFSCCGWTPEVKLNIEWLMTFLAKRINLDMTNEMVTLSALHWVENFKLCNKYVCFLTRHLGLMTRKLLVVDLKSRLDSIWQYWSEADFKQLVTKNSAWFVEPVVAALL